MNLKRNIDKTISLDKYINDKMGQIVDSPKINCTHGIGPDFCRNTSVLHSVFTDQCNMVPGTNLFSWTLICAKSGKNALSKNV